MSEPEFSDEMLIRAIGGGELGAIEHLARRYEGALLGLARGVVGEASARDVVQETWIRVLRGARTFKGRSSGKVWLYRVCTNACLSERRRMARAPSRPSDAGRAASDDDQLHELRAALDRLDHGARMIVLLCYHRGLSHGEAAEALRIPMGTLKSRLHKALSRLRAAMEEQP